jgi:hypothetical protein
MNLFRSEEHVLKWEKLGSNSRDGVADPARLAAQVFSLPRYRERLSPDYLDRVAEHSAGLPAALNKATDGNPFWRPA